MITIQKITPEKLVNSVQLLIPFYPLPNPEQIDEILSKICSIFQIPFTTESDAKQLWRNRIKPSYSPAHITTSQITNNP